MRGQQWASNWFLKVKITSSGSPPLWRSPLIFCIYKQWYGTTPDPKSTLKEVGKEWTQNKHFPWFLNERSLKANSQYTPGKVNINNEIKQANSQFEVLYMVLYTQRYSVFLWKPPMTKAHVGLCEKHPYSILIHYDKNKDAKQEK